MLPSTKYRGHIGRVMQEYVEARLRNRQDIDMQRVWFFASRVMAAGRSCWFTSAISSAER